jgi:hypothetical protein
MNFELLARLGDSPLWDAISWAAIVVYIAYCVALLVNTRAVTGSRQSYLSSTMMRTLCLPLFGAFVFSTAIDALAGNLVSVLFDVWISSIMHRDWQRMKDNDDWWAGKGTKLKGKLRSMFTSHSPAAAGAGA